MSTAEHFNDFAVAAFGLTKRFGPLAAIAGVDVTITRGEIFGFLGPNGSGKTTLLRVLCGLLRPDAGTGHCLGVPLSGPARVLRARQQHIGYLAQRFTLYDDLTVSENLLFRARIFKLDRPHHRLAETLERHGLDHYRNRPAGQLSGGWRQRLMLAACLLHRPQLVLLDEPTAGVDPDARRAFWRDIEQLAGDGLTVLVCTHDLAEAGYCHRIGYMQQGRIVVTSTPTELIARARGAIWWLDGTAASAAETVAEANAVAGVKVVEARAGRLKVTGNGDPAVARAIAALAARHGLTTTTPSPSLEEALVVLVPATSSARIG